MATPDPETPQLAAWQGAFGDAYVDRNAAEPAMLHARTRMWARILEPLAAAPPASIAEVGANIGLNLRALQRLTGARLTAVEPNRKARERMVADGVVPAAQAIGGIAAAIPLPDGAVDMAFTSGVLIHIAPDDLAASCREIHRIARRYVACVEYFADAPQEIPYRGHAGLLFKRDFGSFWLKGFPDLALVDYGFFWKPATGLDNLTWWLFRKGS